MWVVSLKFWVNSYGDAELSSLDPSGVILSVEHHLLNLALKFSMVTVRKVFFCESVSILTIENWI